MIIRLATLEDIPVLRKLVEHAAGELQQKFGTPRFASHMRCIEYGINAREAVVVAEQDLEIVGWCAWVALPEAPEGDVVGLGTWVFEPFRQEGIASDMRDFATKHCRRRGYKRVIGTAAVENAAALASCQAAGFKVVGYEVALDLTKGAQDGEGAKAPDQAAQAAAVLTEEVR